MAAMTTVLKAIITADATQMKTQLAAAEGSLKSFGKKASATGKTLTKKVTLPIGLVGGAGIKMASDFEASMTKIQSLVGLSAETVKDFEEDVKSLSGKTAQAPKDLADAMFFITSAGIRGADATETLEAAAKAAAVGLGETATIADLATSALNAYGAENLSATQATDIMVAAVREGKLEASELAGSMGRVLPLASAMGVKFNEVGAAFAALSRTGTNAAEASTQVRGILASLLRPTKQSEEALTSMGLSSAELRNQLSEKGLLSVLKTLAVEFDGQSEKAAAVFGNIRALSGVMDLLGKNSAGTEAIFASMTDTTGALDDAFAVTSETTAFKLQQAMADLKLALVRVGEVLIPVVVPILTKLADVIGTVASGFAKMPDPLKKATIAFVGLAAAAGPAMRIIGGGATVLGGAIPAFGKLSAKIGAKQGKGLLGRMSGLLGVAKAHPLAFGAAVAGGIVLTKVFGGMRKRAKEARDRMATLSQEFIDAGDPASTLKDRVSELAKELKIVEQATEGAEEATSKFVGEQTLMAELIKQDVSEAFGDAGFNMEELTTAMSTGSDEFERLKKEARRAHITNDEFADSLRNADPEVRAVTSHLAELIDNEQITRKEAEKLLYSMDETADAFDDNRKSLDKMNEEYLKSDAGIAEVTGALGQYGAELIDAAGDTMTYTAAMEKINTALEDKKKITDEVAEDVRRFTNMTYEAVEAEEELIVTEEELIKQQEELDAAMEKTEEQLQRVKDSFDAIVSSMRDSIDEAFELDEAQNNVENAMLGVLDALEKQNDESLTALEREEALITASKNYAGSLGNVAEAMAGMSLDEINTEFENQAAFLESIKDTMPLSEYERLEELLGEIHTDAQNLHGTEIAIGLGITVDYDESMLNFLDMVNQYDDVASFGASVSGFLGATPMASGGIVTAPTLGLIGEAGPEAVIPLDRMGDMGGGTNVTVNVSGSVLTEYDLAETIQNQLIRIKGRNASLEFG
tara:strand:- start:8208 stop:11150 length:2943 start_codon:yes stop_codon:yes gene_type:complete